MHDPKRRNILRMLGLAALAPVLPAFPETVPPVKASPDKLKLMELLGQRGRFKMSLPEGVLPPGMFFRCEVVATDDPTTWKVYQREVLGDVSFTIHDGREGLLDCRARITGEPTWTTIDGRRHAEYELVLMHVRWIPKGASSHA